MDHAQPSTNATSLLTSHLSGDAQATSQLFQLVYKRLKKLAAHYMKAERPDHTLQPTAVVHEAFLRLVDGKSVDWQGKSHFLALAGRQMRRVLVDHARAHNAKKREALLVSLVDAPAPGTSQVIEALALEESLNKLAKRSSRQAHVFEMRFYAGLTVKEIAHILEVSERTVKGDWSVARTWLAHDLYRSASGTPS
jgi:RNA polymerase sigma-70 factor (ECF subfamily)